MAIILPAKKYFLRLNSLQPKGSKKGRIFAGYCDSAMAWNRNIPEFEIRDEKSINSMQSDFGAVRYDKGIMFASDRILSRQRG